MAFNKIADNNVANPLLLNTLRVDGTFTSSGTGIFTGGSQSTVGLIARQSQNDTGADLQQWQRGDGLVWGRINSQGEFQFGSTGSTVRLGATNLGGTGTVLITTPSSTYVGLTIKGQANQTSEYLQIQNSSSSIISSITSGGIFNTNNSQYGNAISFAAPASTTFFLLATLPISTSGTFDHLQIDGIHGGWGSSDFSKSTFLFANRNAFTWKHFLSNRDIMANFKLRAYSQVDGSVQIWASGEAGQFLKFAYNISSAQGGIVTVQNPTGTTSVPSGTVVFDSSNTTTYPPVETQFGGLNIIGTTAATIPFSVRGASSQTADTIQVQDNSANVLGGFSATGRLLAGGSSATAVGSLLLGAVNTVAQQLAVVARETTTVGVVVRGAASQTASLLELQNSAGTVRASVSSGGYVYGVGLYTNGSEMGFETGNGGGRMKFSKCTSTPSNQSADQAIIYFKDGTTSNTLSLVTRAGTAGVEEVLFDNIDESGTSTLTIGPAVRANGGTLATATSGVGFLGLPQNSTTTGAYTVVAADAGKHIYASATRTVTIDSNTNLALPIGTTLTFIAGSGATMTIAITSDTMYLAGPGTTGSRTLAPFGIATAVKLTSTTWIISGNGLT